jgi:hypothetical protein
MPRGNQSDRNLRNEAQAQIDDLADEAAGIQYGTDIDAEDTGYIGDEEAA